MRGMALRSGDVAGPARDVNLSIDLVRWTGLHGTHGVLRGSSRVWQSVLGGLSFLLYQKEGYTTPSTLGCRRPTGRPPPAPSLPLRRAGFALSAAVSDQGSQLHTPSPLSLRGMGACCPLL